MIYFIIWHDTSESDTLYSSVAASYEEIWYTVHAIAILNASSKSLNREVLYTSAACFNKRTSLKVDVGFVLEQ